ncbi:MAG TPA: hypothetical protein PLB91_04790 [Spirochaetales bacterium]|nr:hypothetical protein [Spirochaetales bacterium]HRY53206.1 hypothetical protein [Spirochaetia bacterium]HRZ64147.1 hypothetical protein [Spirochaetia bacterium]
MAKKRRHFPLVALVVLASLTIVGCPSSSSSDAYTLSGTLTQPDAIDGRFAYLKLVASDGDSSSPALYWTKSTAFSGGSATYSLGGIEEGAYVGYAFIDDNGNAAGDGTSEPDVGDWATEGQAISISSDMTANIPAEAWNYISPT